MFKDRKALSANQLIVLVVVFILLTGNWRFYHELIAAFPLHGLNIAFVLSLSVFMGALCVLLLAIVSNRHLLKPALILALITAAICGYFSDTFGTVIDASMLTNAAETDRAEAGDLLSFGLLLRLFLLGVLPAWLVWHWPVKRSTWQDELLSRLKMMGLAFVAIIAAVLPLSAHYSSFIREHKMVRYYANPVFPIYSSIRFLAGATTNKQAEPLKQLGLDAKPQAGDMHRELMILVIGETARADHFSLYGYSKTTNPELSKVKDLVVYRNVSSCGTSTAISVPCIFSQSGQSGFKREVSQHTENVLDVLKHAGISVFWLDNNSSSKGVADRVNYTDFKNPDNNPHCDVECRDTGMLAGLQKLIDDTPGDILIVLHQMGSHGPAYFKRYPKDYERFKPACQSAMLSECEGEHIINAYDNTILYTDHFLAETIKLLKVNESRFETMMLYVSDHGESLGENGVYLHGAPYMMAPDAQTRVPLLIWQGAFNDIDESSLAVRSQQPQSHDAVFQSLLNFYEIDSTLTRENEGLFAVSGH
jgi:lipid A ethanolaminephosphotransferase